MTVRPSEASLAEGYRVRVDCSLKGWKLPNIDRFYRYNVLFVVGISYNEDATFTATENMTTTIINHADLQAMEKLWASVSQWICFLLHVLVLYVGPSSHCDIMYFSVCIVV